MDWQPFLIVLMMLSTAVAAFVSVKVSVNGMRKQIDKIETVVIDLNEKVIIHDFILEGKNAKRN